MATRTLGLMGVLSITGLLSGCVPVGPDPSTIAPIALQKDGDDLRVTFCEPSHVKAITVEQRSLENGRLGPWVELLEIEIGESFGRFDTLLLPPDGVPPVSGVPLDWSQVERGTQLYVGVRDGEGGGFSGQFESPGESWEPGLWLPTQGPPSSEPCEYWDKLTK